MDTSNRSGRAHGYANMPPYVFAIYPVTHSIVVCLAAFLLVWLLRRRPFWPMAAWGLHVMIDVPTHSLRLFPTPLLWPLSDFRIDGIPWSQPSVFFPNVILLVLSYVGYFLVRRHRK